MDDATATIERRRYLNRQAQKAFRERRRRNQNYNRNQNQNQNQNQRNEITWNHLSDNAASAPRLPVENPPPSATSTLPDGMIALDFPTTAATFNSVAVPTTCHGDNNNMTALAGSMNATRTASGTGSPKLSRSLSTSSVMAGISSATNRVPKSSESIGTHPLLMCNQLQAATSIMTPKTSLEMDFRSQPSSSTTNGSNSPDLSSPDKARFSSALHIAARKGNINIVRILLHHGVSCNNQDHENLTPLMHAIIEGHEEVVRELLGHGATINTNDSSRSQSSALHLAVAHRREDILRTLLLYYVEKKISIDPYNERGRTPLHEAIEMEYESAVVMLLNFGADPQSKIRNADRQRYTNSDA